MKSAVLKATIVAIIVASMVVPVAAASTSGTANVPDETAGSGTYIIRLADAPLATYKGGVAGLDGTSPRVTGAAKLDVNTPESEAYRAYLAEQQAAFISTMESTLGRQPNVLFQYDVVYNGMAVELSGAEAAQVAAIPGVDAVQPDVILYPTTDYGPTWIGADGIWDGSSTGGLPGTFGEGVIVGILDTGLNMDHPSFADIGGDGYDHSNPFGAGNYAGLCVTDPDFVCNDKLIGYYIYTGEDHEDEDGHGTHTGSTTAGNVLQAGTVDLSPFQYSPQISGVAPHANVIGYDVCVDGGGCPTSGSIAATNQAAIDGVDVINFSVGGGTSNPWTDTGSLAFLNATEAGLIPVTSAGNNGPGAGTVGSPGDSPWMLTVGASTHNRAGLNAVVDMSGGDTPPPANIDGRGLSEGHGPASIVYAGDFGDALCLNEFPGGTWQNGEIVVCDRGIIARVAKGWNVKAGGAGGLILANSDAGQTLNGDVHHLPAVHIMYDDGVVLKDWLATGSGHMATIAGATIDVDPANADIMAGFSSRGPNVNNTANDIVKPDVTAPGVDIIAAYRDLPPDPGTATVNYGVVSGTSMSSPHTAGSAALLRALYPSWSPAEVISALVSTGQNDGVYKEDGVTPADPFDIGGGRVDLSNGGHPGLVLDETVADFLAANPALGGVPKDLNLATMGEDECAGTCSWRRDVTNALGASEHWTATYEEPAGMTLTVVPADFSLAAGATQTIEVAANVSGLPVGVWAFGAVVLTPDSPDVPVTRLPVAVKPTQGPPIIVVDPASMASTLLPDNVETQALTISNDGGDDLMWEIYEDAGPGGSPELVDWFEDWDSYPTGQDMHGVGGWKGWSNDPNATAYTTDLYARSVPNSIEIVDDSDLVHEYDVDDGLWTYTAWQYIPGDMTGEHYFILLNQYDDGGASNNWSTQVNFSGDADMVLPEGVGSGTSAPLVRDQWTEIRVEINLVSDWQEFYYDGALVFEGSWSDGLSGDGITSIGAVDLWGNFSTAVYYDDLSLVEAVPEECDLPSDIPWVSVAPDSGTTPGGDSSTVDVTFDSTGLSPDTYEGTLCVASNDPATPIVPVPLMLEVIPEGMTMHVGGIEGYFSMDYLGRPVLRIHVLVEDQTAEPLGHVEVDASITVPCGGPFERTRITKPSGNARFHWGCNQTGTWQICVDDLRLGGYVYNPDDNVVTCMDWEQ